MARAVNLSRRLHSEDFDPAESHAKPQQCDDFRKNLSAVLCGDYLAARGKKCDLKAVVSLNGAPCPASACHAMRRRRARVRARRRSSAKSP